MMISLLLCILLGLVAARQELKLIEITSSDVKEWDSVKGDWNNKEELELGWSSLTHSEMSNVLSLEYPSLKHLSFHKGDDTAAVP